MFESPNGIERNKTFRLIQGTIMVVVVIVFFATRPPPPKQDVADGVYHNACCADLSIHGGRISQGMVSLPMKIERERVLVSHVKGRFTNGSMGAAVNDKDEIAIGFEIAKEKRRLSFWADQRVYIFEGDENIAAK